MPASKPSSCGIAMRVDGRSDLKSQGTLVSA